MQERLLQTLEAQRLLRIQGQLDRGSRRVGDCIVYEPTLKDGYARILVGGRKGRNLYVHRIAYELKHGAIPKGMDVLHRCDVRNCWNDVHLYLGTDRDNQRDRNSRNPGSHASGKSQNMTYLKEWQVIEIRKLWPGVSQRKLARWYGTTQGTISNIVRRKTWIYVE